MAISPSKRSNLSTFKKIIYSFFEKNGRILPWRTDYNPFDIFLSEIMLQQTQVERVIPKFITFKSHFNDFKKLADSKLEDVLSLWQGLGYNRRAVALREASRLIVTNFNGQLPKDPDLLKTLPGIGQATAASIAAFAFNLPTVFLETNIRTVFIYHFFNSGETVDDSSIFPLVKMTLDKKNPRKWYSALMDYGSVLKKTVGNLSRKSSGYQKQSPFNGSSRQIRGAILRKLLHKKSCKSDELAIELRVAEPQIRLLLDDLVKEQVLLKSRDGFRIAD